MTQFPAPRASLFLAVDDVALPNETLLAQADDPVQANLSDAGSANHGDDPKAVRLPSGDELPEENPGDFWRKFFAASRPTPAAVRNRVLTLNKDGRNDQVIALIQAALIHGQSQPWMYEVLALSMEIEGYPKKDVERAVLSMSDFGTANYDSLVQSARYLQAFDRGEAALGLLKQASELNADRAEAFVAAIPLIKTTMSAEHAKWALAGAVETLWGDGSLKAREEAESLARQLARQLRRDGKDELAEELQNAVRLASIPDVRVKLAWDGDCDLDLKITEPGGSRCNQQTPTTPGGGRVLDDGFGPNQPFEEYVCARGYTGSYLIEVKRSVGEPVGQRCRLTIEVREPSGEFKTIKQSLEVTLRTDPAPVTVKLEQGRRTAPQQILRAEPVNVRKHVRFASGDAPSRPGAVGFSTQIGVVNEGVLLNAAPVVSPDRRYVRIGLQPWFRNVTAIETFQLYGGAGQAAPANANAQ